jgi:hypothetical protein
MGKIKKFAAINIKKIVGGRDPVRVVEEFLLKLNVDPDAVLKDKSVDSARWLVPLNKENELEVLVENIRSAQETTFYLGINVMTVPIRGSADLLAAALEIADGLVGIKLSLVGYYLVLSATLGGADIAVDDLEYHYRLMTAQRRWFLDALSDEIAPIVTEDA